MMFNKAGKALLENTTYKSSNGSTIYWNMVIESVSSNDDLDALTNKEYHLISDYECETLADARKVAEASLAVQCITNDRYGAFEVTYILYDNETDELVKLIDDTLVV